MLKLSTVKSVYKPIVIDIDGIEHKAKPIDRATLRKMGELEKRIRAGDADVAYEQLNLLFGKHKAFDNLELRQVNEIIAYVTRQLFAPEKIDEGENETEKNEKRSGGKDSA